MSYEHQSEGQVEQLVHLLGLIWFRVNKSEIIIEKGLVFLLEEVKFISPNLSEKNGLESEEIKEKEVEDLWVFSLELVITTSHRLLMFNKLDS